MLWLTSMLTLATDDAKIALDRFANYVRRSPVISVDIRTQVDQFAVESVATFTLQKPDRVRYKLNWGPTKYEFVAQGSRRIEIDHSRKSYVEHNIVGQLLPMGELLENAQYLYPSPFVLGDIRALLPANTKFKAGKIEAAGSSMITPVVATSKSESAEMTYTAKIDQTGRLVSLRIQTKTEMVNEVWNHRFSNYRTDLVSAIVADPPLGYSPSRVPTPVAPLLPGEQFPTEGWMNSTNNQRLNVKRSGYTLAAFGRPYCTLTPSLMMDLKGQQSQLSRMGVNVLFLLEGNRSTAQRLSAGFPAYYDATSNAGKALRAPGTPSLFLIDSQGSLVKIWFGYSPSLFKKYLKELQNYTKS